MRQFIAMRSFSILLFKDANILQYNSNKQKTYFSQLNYE